MSEQNGDLNAALSLFWGVVERRRWWVLATTCLISLAVVRASFLIPDQFRSDATIFISKPRIPEQYIVPNNTANAMEAVEATKREIISRARLLQMIDEFNLYPNQRQIGSAALTELMRANLEVLPLSKDPERRPMNAFLIAFTCNDPQKAQQVTNRLAALFIHGNAQKQQQIDSGTTTFLEQQLAAAKAELDKQETVVRDYKMRNLGALPEQSAGNLEILSGQQIQLETAQASLERARQQRTYLQSMLTQEGSPATVSDHSGQEVSAAGSIASLREELIRLRRERDDLLSRYSAQYPDVANLNRRIVDEELQLTHLVTASKLVTGDGKGSQPSSDLILPADPATIQLRSQLQANAIEIADAESRVKGLEVQIAAYRQRLTLAPIREQQMEDVVRNYEASKQNYANLLNKKTQSELATNLAMQQSDEQFQIIDPASLPIKPSSPQRQKIALFGLAGGVLAGLALAFLIDARDRSFHLESDVRKCFQVPLVVGVPPLLTVREKRKLARRMSLEWVMGCLVAVLLAATQFYVLLRG